MRFSKAKGGRNPTAFCNPLLAHLTHEQCAKACELITFHLINRLSKC
uniref:Uncharacterized protein n=1 Tax=Anguilla anguilla TaxID=7936 RepID=A0A0E9SJM8_ANGAN